MKYYYLHQVLLYLNKLHNIDVNQEIDHNLLRQ